MSPTIGVLWKGSLAALLTLETLACERSVAPARHAVPPSVRVLSPTVGAYDLDGDSLVDLKLAWTDSGGAVNAAAVRVRSLAGVSASGGDTSNLLDHWRVEQRDATGLLAHETIGYLLHGGLNRLEISVPDTSGKVTVDTITFNLPYAAWVETIGSGSGGTTLVSHLALCSDDHRLYMPVYFAGLGYLVVVDADSLRVLSVVGPGAGELHTPLCVPGDPILYITGAGGVTRFDRSASQFLSPLGIFTGYGITQSRANPDLLYIGWMDGVVGVASRSGDSTLGYLLTFRGTGPNPDYIWDVAVLPGDAKLFAASLLAGILVADPQRNVLLDSMYISGSRFALARDGRYLFVSTYSSVREIDTGSDRVISSLALVAPHDIALSPDGSRMFVTRGDSSNVLVDLTVMQVIQDLPRPMPHQDNGVVFAPDGRHIFVAHNSDVDVYLHRP